MQELSNLVFIAASVGTLGLLLVGGVEIYSYLWKRIGELKNENRSNRA